MRLIVNAISAHTGGIVTYTSFLIEYLKAFKVDSQVYVPARYHEGVPDDDGAPVRLHRLDVSGYRGFFRFLWEQTGWRRIVKRSGADVLFSSANYGLISPPIRQVLLVQGEIAFNPVYRERVLPRLTWVERIGIALRQWLMVWSARHSDLVVFPSKVALESVVGVHPSIKDKSVVDYLAVNTDLPGLERQRPWRDGGQLKLLYVSIYYPHKDPQTLAEATRLMHDGGIEAHAWITMEPRDFWPWSTGRADLPPLLDAQADGMVTLGRLDYSAIGSALTDHDVMVYPSFAETFGFPLVEAMAAGMPVVAADTPIHREICGDAVLYFEPANPADLAERLRELDEDADLRRRLSRAGKARVQDNFLWDQHMSQLIDAMRKL
jgi:glycosyltransferase involved in cell wall biosynthesis